MRRRSLRRRLVLTVEQVIAEGDSVLMRSHVAATFSGLFMGLPPTGKPIAWRFHNIYRVHDGWWVEAWTMPDSLSMMRQLGEIAGSSKRNTPSTTSEHSTVRQPDTRLR